MRYFVLSCVVLLLFFGCSQKEPTLSEVLKYDQNTDILPAAPDIAKAEFDDQAKLYEQKLFSVWDDDKLWGNEKDVTWGFELFENGKFVGENRVNVDKAWFDEIKTLANVHAYGSFKTHAITTANTNLRVFPTDKPLFGFSESSFNYPFDSLQNSFLAIMQPIIVSHYSTDRAWAFVESAFASGWIKSNELTLLNENMTKRIKNAAKIVIIKDNAPLFYTKGAFAQYLKLGTVLPAISQNDRGFEVLIVQNSPSGFGIEASAQVASGHASWFPLEFNDQNVRLISAELLGENYGWGGLYTNRDCSAMTRDFYSAFGVWLPRNSRAQKNAAFYFDMANLSSDTKEKRLIELGVPYMTLVYMPGHVMIYAGAKEGKALVFHNIWGLKTKDDGRFIIGKSIISDLALGQNAPSVDEKSVLANKIQGFTILAPKTSERAARLFYAYQGQIDSIANNTVYFKNGAHIAFDDGKNKSFEQMLDWADAEDMFAQNYKKGAPDGKPQNDAGRVRDEEFFKAVYGANQNEIEKNLVKVVWLPSSEKKTLLFNRNNGAADALQAVSNELDKLNSDEIEFLKNIGGTYKYRNIAYTDRLSPHAFGIAIDINTKYSHYWRWDNPPLYQNLIPQKIVDIFEKHGFIWGGKWIHYDTMHFEFRPELLK